MEEAQNEINVRAEARNHQGMEGEGHGERKIGKMEGKVRVKVA